MIWLLPVGVGLMLGGFTFWLMKKHEHETRQRYEDEERLRRWTKANQERR